MNAPKTYPHISDALVLFIIVILLQLLSGSIIAAIHSGEKAGINNWELACANIIAMGAAILVGFTKGKASAGEIFPLKGFPLSSFFAIAAAVIGLSIILSETDNVFRFVFPMPEYISNILLNFHSKSDMAGSYFLLGIVAPITEELLFRGVILRGFLKNYRLTTAVLASSLLFALIHINPWQMISAFAAGVYLSFLLIKTGSIIPCILAHSLFNSMPLLATKFIHVEIPGYTIGGLAGPVRFQPVWFDMLGVLLLVAGAYITSTQSNADTSGHGAP